LVELHQPQRWIEIDRSIMSKPTKRRILELLTKVELLELVSHFHLLKPPNACKSNLVDVLIKRRAIPLRDYLATLNHDSLKRLCSKLGMDVGATKGLTLATLTGDSLLAAGELVKQSLRRQGFSFSGNSVTAPALNDKNKVREVHRLATEHKKDAAKKALERKETKLLARIAEGHEVHPDKIDPQLILVESDSEDEELFRYATLHWSIPISPGYGRRLRVLVVDGYNDKLIGIVGLCDPVFALRARDSWVGWSHEQRRQNISKLVDAYVLGAVPPYSSLLCGKLVAMLACSDEVRIQFRNKYSESRSLIADRVHDGEILAISTTSALGRSSIYNRLKMHGDPIFESVGFTAGNGDFQFLNGAYDLIQNATLSVGAATAKHENWGTGYRNRREVVQEFLKATGISPTALQHGIKREVFLAALAKNTRDVLCGRETKPNYRKFPATTITEFFRNRWLLPRAAWDKNYESFERESWRLW
jgi:hypothetical protein